MANVGYVQIPHFAVAVERRRQPDLYDSPVILGGYPHERKPVYDASSEAAALGVQPGQPLRQAQQLCPLAVFLPLAEDRYQEAAATFLATIECFSPAVEPAAPGSAYFDARGLEPLFGTEEQLAHRLLTSIADRLGLTASVGFGPTRFTALVAARLSQPGGCLVVSTNPAEFLSSLSIDQLRESHHSVRKHSSIEERLAETCFEHLRLLGIRTIGQFFRLPPSELMEQLGPAGTAAYHLACGDGDELLAPRQQPAALQRTKTYEPPLSPALLPSVIAQLSAGLAAELQSRYQACQTIILRVEQDGRAIAAEQTAQLKRPAAQPDSIANAALRLIPRLAQEPPSQPVVLSPYASPLHRGGEGQGEAPLVPTASQTVIPASVGIHRPQGNVDARFRGHNDRHHALATPEPPLPNEPNPTAPRFVAPGLAPGRPVGYRELYSDHDPQIIAIQLVVTGIVTQSAEQLSLFDAQRQRRAYLKDAEAEIRRRFGPRLKRAKRRQPSASITASPFVLEDYFDCAV